MQDVDRPANIESLAQPARARCSRVEKEPLRVVLGAKNRDRISGHGRGRRDLGQKPAVRPAELKRAVRFAIHPITLLVDRAMVPTTEEREIRQCGGAAFGPVAHVMRFAQWETAAREAAPAVSMMKGPP
jgi:hypothetical protein